MTAAEKKCETTVVNFTDIVKDEIIQCQKISEKKCYTSQETVFETHTVPRWGWRFLQDKLGAMS